MPFKDGAILSTSPSNKKISQGIFWVDTDSASAKLIAPIVHDDFADIGTDNDHLIFLQGQNSRTYSFLGGKWAMTKSSLDTVKWTSICYDKKDKSYWVSIWNTLIHYNSDFDIIHRYFVDGVLYGDAILGISPDGRGHIWMRFLRSVSWLDVETGKITALTEKDGFKSRPLGGNLLEMAGELYFLGGGLNRVSPDKLVTNYPASIAYFKSLEIDQKSFPLSTGINDLEELSLRYNENEIRIGTGTIDYYTKIGKIAISVIN